MNAHEHERLDDFSMPDEPSEEEAAREAWRRVFEAGDEKRYDYKHNNSSE